MITADRFCYDFSHKAIHCTKHWIYIFFSYINNYVYNIYLIYNKYICRKELHQNISGKLKLDAQVDLSSKNLATCQNFTRYRLDTESV